MSDLNQVERQESFVVVESAVKKRRRSVWAWRVSRLWTRKHIVALEAAFAGTLAALSVILAIYHPADSERGVLVTFTLVFFALFVGSVYARSKIDNKDKAMRTARESEVFALMTRMGAELTELRNQKITFVPAPSVPQQATESATTAAEPDIALRFTTPNEFVLHNYGSDATEVTIERVVIDEYVSDVWGSMSIRTPEQTTQFPIIDVDRGESADIRPTITHFGIALPNSTMVQFFKELIKRRRIDALGLNASASQLVEDGAPPEEVWARMQEIWRLEHEPLDIPMRLSYTGRLSGRRWETIETLHYDPQTNAAYVKHGRPREITTAS